MENAVVFIWLVILGYIGYIDIKELRIPNQLLIVLLLWYPMILFFVPWQDSFMGGLIGGGLFLLTSVLLPNKVGMGDVKLMTVVGLYLGKETILLCMMMSLFLAAVVGIILILWKKIDRKTGIPYGPFVFLATILCYIEGIR